MANRLVAVCGDADCFAGVDKGADHSRADVGLARTRRPLNGKYAAIDRFRDASRGGEGRFFRFLDRLPSDPGRQPHEQVARCEIRPVGLHSLLRDMLAEPHQRSGQNTGANDIVRKL